jgi:hypothetical protein
MQPDLICPLHTPIGDKGEVCFAWEDEQVVECVFFIKENIYFAWTMSLINGCRDMTLIRDTRGRESIISSLVRYELICVSHEAHIEQVSST